jgi:pyruvate dehydrogenase E2 component (dihydrolipoamide acetyltransferase)
MLFDVTETEKELQRLKEEHGITVSFGTLVGKAVSVGLAEQPQINAKVLGRRIYLKQTVDIYYQIDVGKGSDLTGTVISEVDKMSLPDIATALSAAAEKIRSGRDKQYEQTQKRGLFKWAPIWLLSRVLDFISFGIFRLQLPSKWFGASEPDPFGSAMVSNVGGFGVNIAYAPLVPWTHVPYVFLVGAARDMPWVVDGELTVRKILPVSCTFDHRVIDGANFGPLIETVRTVIEDRTIGWEGLSPAKEE